MRTRISQSQVASLCVAAWFCAASARADVVVLVTGAAGESTYEPMFTAWTARWESAAAEHHDVQLIHAAAELTDEFATQLEAIESTLSQLAGSPPDRLWIVLIGHGTDDGRAAKFNLEGADLTAEQLDQWLDPIACPTAVIHCGAASSRFIDALSGPGRIIITATRSPAEVNFARFGEALSESIAGTEGDFDKDGQTSLLEAFLRASRITRQFYDSDSRLATEHALIDDNGDARGSVAEDFSETDVLILNDPAQDGLLSSQWCLSPAAEEGWLTPELRTRRDELEAALRDLRSRRTEFTEDAYFAALEPLLLEMAELYEAGER